MSKFYSPSKRGFYCLSIHTAEQLPSDVLEISDEEHRRLLYCQTQGKAIEPHPDHGYPQDVDPIESAEHRGIRLRVHRNKLLADSDNIVARHRDEMEANPSLPTLSNEQYAALQAWRAALRALPQQPDWPNVEIPAKPEFLANGGKA